VVKTGPGVEFEGCLHGGFGYPLCKRSARKSSADPWANLHKHNIGAAFDFQRREHQVGKPGAASKNPHLDWK